MFLILVQVWESVNTAYTLSQVYVSPAVGSPNSTQIDIQNGIMFVAGPGSTTISAVNLTTFSVIGGYSVTSSASLGPIEVHQGHVISITPFGLQYNTYQVTSGVLTFASSTATEHSTTLNMTGGIAHITDTSYVGICGNDKIILKHDLTTGALLATASLGIWQGNIRHIREVFTDKLIVMVHPYQNPPLGVSFESYFIDTVSWVKSSFLGSSTISYGAKGLTTDRSTGELWFIQTTWLFATNYQVLRFQHPSTTQLAASSTTSASPPTNLELIPQLAYIVMTIGTNMNFYNRVSLAAVSISSSLPAMAVDILSMSQQFYLDIASTGALMFSFTNSGKFYIVGFTNPGQCASANCQSCIPSSTVCIKCAAGFALQNLSTPTTPDVTCTSVSSIPTTFGRNSSYPATLYVPCQDSHCADCSLVYDVCSTCNAGFTVVLGACVNQSSGGTTNNTTNSTNSTNNSTLNSSPTNKSSGPISAVNPNGCFDTNCLDCTLTPSHCSLCTPKYVTDSNGNCRLTNCNPTCFTCDDQNSESCLNCAGGSMLLPTGLCSTLPYQIITIFLMGKQQNSINLPNVDMNIVFSNYDVLTKQPVDALLLASITKYFKFNLQFINVETNTNEAVNATGETMVSGDLINLAITVNSPPPSKRYTVVAGISDQLNITYNASHGVVVYPFLSYALYVAQQTANEVAQATAQGEIVGLLAAGTPIPGAIPSSAVMAAASTDPSGILARATQFLKVLNRLAFVNVNFGPKLTAYLNAVAAFSYPLSEPPGVEIRRVTNNYRFRLTTTKLLVTFQSQLFGRIVFYVVSWTLNYSVLLCLNMIMKMKPYKFVLWIIYFMPKVHLFVINTFISDFLFYGGHAMLHSSQPSIWLTATLTLFLLSIDGFWISSWIWNHASWRWVIDRKLKLKAAILPNGSKLDEPSVFRTDSLTKISPAAMTHQDKLANSNRSLLFSCRANDSRSHNFFRKFIDSGSPKLKSQSNSLVKPDLKIDYARTAERIQLCYPLTDFMSGPLSPEKRVFGQVVFRVNYSLHYLQIFLHNLMIVGGQTCNMLSITLLIILEIAKGVFTGSQYLYRVGFQSRLIFINEVFESIFFVVFLSVCLLLANKKRNEPIGDGIQLIGIITVTLSCAFEYILSLSYVALSIFTTIQDCRKKKNKQLLDEASRRYSPLQYFDDSISLLKSKLKGASSKSKQDSKIAYCAPSSTPPQNKSPFARHSFGAQVVPGGGGSHGSLSNIKSSRLSRFGVVSESKGFTQASNGQVVKIGISKFANTNEGPKQGHQINLKQPKETVHQLAN